MIKLSGKELRWILRLANGHYDSKNFRKFIKEYDLQKLDRFLKLLLLRFHPNNFNWRWNSRAKWILLTEEEMDEAKVKWFESIPKEGSQSL